MNIYMNVSPPKPKGERQVIICTKLQINQMTKSTYMTTS